MGPRDKALTGYVRQRLQRFEAETGKKIATAAKEVGLPGSGANQVKNGKLGVEGGTVDQYAKMLGFREGMGLRTEAAAWWEREGKHQPATGAASQTVVRTERYQVMPTVRDAARSDGIPADFIATWEAKLDFDGQPPFRMLYDLLSATYNASRGKLISRKVEDDADF